MEGLAEIVPGAQGCSGGAQQWDRWVGGVALSCGAQGLDAGAYARCCPRHARAPRRPPRHMKPSASGAFACRRRPDERLGGRLWGSGSLIRSRPLAPLGFGRGPAQRSPAAARTGPSVAARPGLKAHLALLSV